MKHCCAGRSALRRPVCKRLSQAVVCCRLRCVATSWQSAPAWHAAGLPFSPEHCFACLYAGCREGAILDCQPATGGPTGRQGASAHPAGAADRKFSVQWMLRGWCSILQGRGAAPGAAAGAPPRGKSLLCYSKAGYSASLSQGAYLGLLCMTAGPGTGQVCRALRQRAATPQGAVLCHPDGVWASSCAWAAQILSPRL